MPLTKEFNETVKARAERDDEFRLRLLTEAIEAMVSGEWDVAKLLLRDYINATEGFEALGKAVDKSPKSLMRMLGEKGNPTATNLFKVTRFLREKSGVRFDVVPVKEHTKGKRQPVT